MTQQRVLSAHLSGLLTDLELAAYLRKPPKTLANWRHLGIGPTYIKVGNRVVYRETDVAAWLADHTVTPGAA